MLTVQSVVPESLIPAANVLTVLAYQGTEADLLSFRPCRQKDGLLFGWASDNWPDAQWQRLLDAKQDGITAMPPEFVLDYMAEQGLTLEAVSSVLANMVVLDELPDPETVTLPTTMVVAPFTGLAEAYGLETYEPPEPEPEPEPEPDILL